MHTTNLVFFPILWKEHYFLVVFDLKNHKMEVIDNDKNKTVPVKFIDNLKTMFKQFLTIINHPKVNGFEIMKMEKMELDWQTKNNSIDCGLFLMRHMEVYRGGGADKMEAYLEPESDDQKP